MSRPYNSKESGYDWYNISTNFSTNNPVDTLKYKFLSKVVFSDIKWIQFKSANLHTQLFWNKKLQVYNKSYSLELDFIDRKGLYDKLERLWGFNGYYIRELRRVAIGRIFRTSVCLHYGAYNRRNFPKYSLRSLL